MKTVSQEEAELYATLKEQTANNSQERALIAECQDNGLPVGEAYAKLAQIRKEVQKIASNVVAEMKKQGGVK